MFLFFWKKSYRTRVRQLLDEIEALFEKESVVDDAVLESLRTRVQVLSEEVFHVSPAPRVGAGMLVVKSKKKARIYLEECRETYYDEKGQLSNAPISANLSTLLRIAVSAYRNRDAVRVLRESQFEQYLSDYGVGSETPAVSPRGRVASTASQVELSPERPVLRLLC